MSKTRPGHFFENFWVGQSLVHGTPRTLSEGDRSLYIAFTGARHPLHCAAPLAAACGYPATPLHDFLVFNIGFGKTVPDISLNAVANLGYADLRFLRPVYPGDTLTADSTVIGLKQNSSGKNGVVYVRSTVRDQHGQDVLTWIRWVMVNKRNLAAPAPEPLIPELPESVPAERLAIPAFLRPGKLDPAATAGRDYWEDYRPGERIDNASGMTLDESDHTLATKLYQNPARLHFNAQAAGGKRLVYGGHVIAVCHALNYEGLENVLNVAAINAGAHCNPSYAGDTLYASTEVLEQWPLPGRNDLGALRLRLVGTKNIPAAEIRDRFAEQNGKPTYHPNVVLDLDYTVLMPRRTAMENR